MVTHENLKLALHVAAQIVARDGADFLPIFERLEREVGLADERLSAMARAQSLAIQGGRGGWH